MSETNNASTPLSESTLFIMLSLSTGPLHGYAIMKDVLSISRGRVNLTAGTLYGALKRLLTQGWIERVPDDDAESANPGLPRKAYRLSDIGRDMLQAETERVQAVAEVLRLHKADGV